ncbi:hypothetical protein GALL_299580 [mine drainage metagenome]|uniref:Pilus assembly protein CpaE n=1 Tax=mine drainage metagenome TaxID=410659 RepID=A0A1J5R7W2_9ZZZZ
MSADTGAMITAELATALQLAGLHWHPQPGDRFAIPQPGLHDQVFTISDMVVEPHEYPTGTVLGFNGTTEWALDSVDQEQAVWLPREDQLRELLGATFRRLEHTDDGYRVVVTGAEAGIERAHTAASAAEAYGLALLDLVSRATDVLHP